MPALACSSVCPSGSACLTAVAAIEPPPPPRDLITNTWPVLSLTFLATSRCRLSALAPGVNGTTMVMGRDDSNLGGDWPAATDPDQNREEATLSCQPWSFGLPPAHCGDRRRRLSAIPRTSPDFWTPLSARQHCAGPMTAARDSPRAATPQPADG